MIDVLTAFELLTVAIATLGVTAMLKYLIGGGKP